MNSRWSDLFKKAVSIAIAVAILPALCCAFYMSGLLLSWNPFVLWGFQQKRLASELRVNIDDYPYPRYFPLGYYETKLGPGTDISEVHQTITGYRKALRCSKREVYYYFSSDEAYSLRLEVEYNDDLTVASINSEDEDYRTIGTEDCSEGLLAE